MKAQILKIAGVKTEAEFYKKYPTEEAFMKKHGKELKKAQVGASLKTTGSLKPQGLSSSAKALPTLTSPVAASTGAFNQSVDGADFFGNTASNYGYNPNAYIPSPNENSGNSFKSKMQGIGSKIKQGMEESTKEADLSVDSGLAGMIGGIASGISTINQTKKNIKELGKYGKISDVAATAATSRPERSRRMYVRPEDNLVMAANPLGKASSLLAAQNGAEIANTFAPNTIYTDMGYEPLNDSDKVKAFKKGGKIKKAEIGAMIGMANSAADLSRASGQIGGLLGSQWGGAGGETGGYSQALGGFGLVGGIVGGLLDAPMLKKQKQAQNHINNNLALTNMQSGMNSPHMENGGWMNPEYNPQVIAKFGEYSMDQLLAPPHDADMLRAGGHLKEYTPPSARAMYTGRDLPYQMEDGGQMAMGGDLQVHRGEAETLSYNPFLPNGGETIMFRGPSHDNGGMPITFGQNGVEVEGGEPAQVMQDGGEAENLVVYGNMIIPKYGVEEIGDPKAKGKKFKHYVADLSKIEAKQNKIVEKSTNVINSLEVNDPFSKLTFAANQANVLGANMKLKEIADKKLNTAAVQNAILDTAEEYQLVSDELAKGKIVQDKEAMKKAKFGAKMTTAQFGINASPLVNQTVAQGVGNFLNTTNDMQGAVVTPDNYLSKLKEYEPINAKEAITGLLDLLKSKGIDTNVTSGYRPNAKTKQGKPSRHSKNEAMDVTFPKLGSAAYNAMLGDQDIVAYMMSNGLTAINEYDPKILKKTGGTGPHVHIGLDKNTKTADQFRVAAAQRHPQVVQQILSSSSPSRSGLGYSPMASGVAAPASGSAGLPQLPKRDVDYLNDLYTKAQKAGKGPAVLKFQQEYHRLAPEYAKAVISNDPLTSYAKQKGYGVGDLRGNEDSRFGKRTKEYLAAINSAPVTTSPTAPLPAKKVTPITTGLSAAAVPNIKVNQPVSVDTKPDYFGKAANFARSIMPWLAPSNQEPLDPSQLSGEYMALATNQLEPVQAQLVQPLLEQPFDISLQDQLNANQADFNAMQRQTGYNPEALSALAAQKYAANSQVLGNQFRANQEMKAGVYNKNREILNQTQLQNLGILDQQYTRQEQAKSNTKQQAIAALNSINDKILKNKLDNRKLSIYENMYGYRFGPNGQAYNVNGPAALNFAGNSSGRSTGFDNIAPGYEALLNTSGQVRAISPVKDKTSTSGDIDPLGLLAKNGKKIDKNKPNSNIVKAIKGL